jgi:hypothetical protein
MIENRKLKERIFYLEEEVALSKDHENEERLHKE